mmetsp:Transcript_6372/g.17252  ORF Transcript_6372/g.17252 Transcript_6372/m.17252 type:complete len:214 (-) Transcript_6372:15-656(-)
MRKANMTTCRCLHLHCIERVGGALCDVECGALEREARDLRGGHDYLIQDHSLRGELGDTALLRHARVLKVAHKQIALAITSERLRARAARELAEDCAHEHVHGAPHVAHHAVGRHLRHIEHRRSSRAAVLRRGRWREGERRRVREGLERHWQEELPLRRHHEDGTLRVVQPGFPHGPTVCKVEVAAPVEGEACGPEKGQLLILAHKVGGLPVG